MASGFPMAMFCEPQVEKCNVFLPVLTEKREILQPVARKMSDGLRSQCSGASLPAAPWRWVDRIKLPVILPPRAHSCVLRELQVEKYNVFLPD